MNYVKSKSMIVKKNSEVRVRRFKESLLVILNETFYELNDSSEIILKMCNGKNTIKEIVDYLKNVYEVENEKIEQDCMEIIEMLIQTQVVEIIKEG